MNEFVRSETFQSAKLSSSRPANGDAVDWCGLWFSFEEEDGAYVGMRAGQRRSDGDGMDWVFLPHLRHDGLGGFALVLEERGLGDGIKLPSSPETSKPSLFARTWALIKVLTKPAKTAAAWNTLDRGWQPSFGLALAGDRIATQVVSPEMLQRLKEVAYAQGVTLNSLLFSTIAQAGMSELDDGPVVWSIPINMRGPVWMERPTANHCSFLDIDVGRNPTPRSVHGELRKALRGGEHWGNWSILNCGPLIGVDGMRKLYRSHLDACDGRPYVGTFSNMGEWSGIGEWFVCGHVTSANPLCASVMFCDDAMTMTIEAHPSIAPDVAWVERLMARWVDQLHQ